MASDGPVAGRREAELLRLYDGALPEVYGYLLLRCGDPSLAEDLTAETFHAAVSASRRAACGALTTPWLVGVARHKLVDHWRRQAREERALTRLRGAEAAPDRGWEERRLEALRARATLAGLNPTYRAALTLHHADGLTTAEVAALLGRTLHATEALLVRARAAFRRAYAERQEDG
ncbi:MAG: RNA polymerase sigma factor [Candidatus Dormibacteraceae bacterium]